MQGVIVYFRVVDGEMRVGDTIRLINTAKEYQVGELGVLAPKPVQVWTISFLLSRSQCGLDFKSVGAVTLAWVDLLPI